MGRKRISSHVRQTFKQKRMELFPLCALRVSLGQTRVAPVFTEPSLLLPPRVCSEWASPDRRHEMTLSPTCFSVLGLGSVLAKKHIFVHF